MSMEAPQNLTRAQKTELLRQDQQYRSLVGAWLRITKSPQRPQIRQWIRERRVQILNAPDPRKEVDRSNLEVDYLSNQRGVLGSLDFL